MFFPPSMDSDELRDRFGAMVDGEPWLPLVSDSLEHPDRRSPGKGWVLITAYEGQGYFVVSCFPEHPRLDELRASLDLVHGRAWSGAADLSQEQAAAAARLDAVLGVEFLPELAERYRIGEPELAAWELAVPSQAVLPEEIIGVTIVYRYAG